MTDASAAGSIDRSRSLLEAAKRLEPLDLMLARETYLDALSAAIFAGRLAGRIGLLEVAEAARAAPSSPHPPRPSDLLLDGLAVLITEGNAAGAPILRRALNAFRDENLSGRGGAPLAPAHLPSRHEAVGRRELVRALNPRGPARSRPPAH
jgi:hypothetical protein